MHIISTLLEFFIMATGSIQNPPFVYFIKILLYYLFHELTVLQEVKSYI
jgi:hypothetical protein